MSCHLGTPQGNAGAKADRGPRRRRRCRPLGRRSLSILGAGLLILLLAAACAAPAAAPPKAAPSPAAKPAKVDTLRIGVISQSAGFTSVFAADKKGFFEKENIKAEVTVTRVPTTGLQGVTSGSLDIFASSTDPAIRAIEEGANLSMVGGYLSGAPFTLMVQSTIQKLSDLKGKKIALSTPGAVDTLLWKILLKQQGAGLKWEDFDWINVGGTPERYAALKSGAVAGTLISQPDDFRAMKEGFKKLMTTTELVKEYQTGVIVVHKDWAKANQDLLVRFLRAHLNTTRWLNDPKNKEEVVQFLVTEFKAAEDDARQTYDLYFVQSKPPMIPPESDVNIKGMEVVIEAMAEVGEFKGRATPTPQKYLDFSYLEMAKKR